MADFEIKDGVGIIPEGTTVIENYAFNNCTELTSIVIPDSVTKIGWNAFSGCTCLTNIVVPDSVTEIGCCAFEGCKNLSKIVIPPSVTIIDRNLFEDCTNLTRVILPKTVTKIKEKAFYGCTNLTEIVIPNSVTEIEDWAFCDCSYLAKITLPKSLKTINRCVFRGCTAITSIVIPKSVEIIESGAFDDCTSLSELNLPNSLKVIDYSFISGCTKISHIDIPASVTRIGKDAFVGCENLTSIAVSKRNKFYDSRDNCNAIINKQKNELFIACAGTKMIPNTVTSIASQVFYNHTELVSIEIPESVQTIGEEAFQECTSLETVIFKGTVKNIGEDVFDQCNHLKTIVVPDGKTDFYKDRLDEELWDKIVETSQPSRKEGSEVAVSTRVYKTKGGQFTVSIGDVFARGKIYLDRDAYISRYQYFTDDLYRVVAVYQKYLKVVDNQDDSEIIKLYPNLETDYFTTLAPAKFKKQWAYDEYYPGYYCLLTKDGDIREPELSSEVENDTPLKDNDSKTFTIEGETWEEKELINALERQFKKLYPSRRLDIIEFEYEEGLEYYFNCLADDMNYQIMIDSETGNIHWDREL